MNIREGLTFDDVLLVPQHSNIISRSQTDLKTRLSKKIALNIPMVSANMDTVTEANMAIAFAREGGIGIVHRFLNIEDQAELVRKVKRSESIIIEQPYTITSQQKIKDAIDHMKKFGISGLIVVDNNNKLVGIITSKDIRFESNLERNVADIMTKNVVTAKHGITIDEAKEILHNNSIEKLPLIDEEKNIKGLITGKDITKMNEYPFASKD